eukprot:UN04897
MSKCIVFFYFLYSWIYLPCTRSVENVSVEKTCFNHEGVLVLLCLNVFLNTLLADIFSRIDVK